MEGAHSLQKKLLLLCMVARRKWMQIPKPTWISHMPKSSCHPPATCGGAGLPTAGPPDTRISLAGLQVIQHGGVSPRLLLSVCSMLGSGTCIAILCPQLLVPSRDYFEGQLECQLQPSAPCKKEVASEQPVCCLVCLHWIVPESIAIAGCVFA